MADPKIPLSDLPAGVPGAFDKVAGVDTATGAARLFSASDMPASSQVNSRLVTLEQGQTAGMLGFATKADMDASLAHPAGTLALVTSDTTASNNGTYRKTGASGSGSWVQSADRVTGLEGRVGAVESLPIMPHYPILSSNVAANAGGSADLLARIRRGVLDLKLNGLPSSDSYYIERLRRNVSGNWHIVVKRASDAVSVLQFFGPLGEPPDPSIPMDVTLTGLVAGASGVARVRWSEFVDGASNTGLNVTLSPLVLRRDVATPLQTMPWQSARMGLIVMPFTTGQVASVNTATRTFTWPEMLIIDGRANNAGRYRLQAGSVTFSAPFQVAWIDLAEVASYGDAQIPASVVKVAGYSYGGGQTAATRYVAEPQQFPLAWSSGAADLAVNPLIPKAEPPPSGGYRDDIVVNVNVPGNEVSVYMRANGQADSLDYIRYRLLHHVAADADVWTIAGVWAVERTGNESFSAGTRLMVEGAEILYAQQEQGAADFTGGYAHGDEVVLAAPVLIIDGQELVLSGSVAGWYHASEVVLVQRTQHYRVGSALGTALARRGLVLTFRNGEMVADQRINHLAAYNIANAYSAMLVPHRYVTYVAGVSEDPGSTQISGKYAENGRFTTMDVSARQAAANPSDDYVKLVPPVTRVKMWGSAGVECEVEVLEASAPILTDIFFMQRNNYAYNKAYIGMIGGYSGIQAVTPATVWAFKTRWAFRKN